MEEMFSLVCHQDANRSLWSETCLLCSRCSGFYIGVTCVILFLLILSLMKGIRNDINVETLVLSGVMIVISPLQMMLEQYFDILNSNTLRYMLGVATGSAVMWLLLCNVLKSNEKKACPRFKITFKICLLLNVVFCAVAIMLLFLWPVQFVMSWLCIVGIVLLFTALLVTLLSVLFSVTNLMYRIKCKFLGYV